MFGDKKVLNQFDAGWHIQQLINNNNDENPSLTVRLGLFYSSTLELYNKASQLHQINNLSFGTLQQTDYPPVDIFIRTSGEPKMSDLMLFELSSGYPTYTPQLKYNITNLSHFKFYILLTKWQFFRMDIERLRKKMNTKRNDKIKSRQSERNQCNDEIDVIRQEYNSDRSSGDSGVAYFMYD